MSFEEYPKLGPLLALTEVVHEPSARIVDDIIVDHTRVANGQWPHHHIVVETDPFEYKQALGKHIEQSHR